MQADWLVSVMTGGITLAMFFLGGMADKLGVKKALIISLLFMFAGRIVLASGPLISHSTGPWSLTFNLTLLGILGVVIGYGMYQPGAYAAVRKFSDEKTASMGYAMLYAVMNLGGFLPGFISPLVRKNYYKFLPEKLSPEQIKHYDILAVFWVYSALTLLGIIVFAIIVNRKAVEKALAQKAKASSKNPEEEKEKQEKIEKEREELKKLPFIQRVKHWFKNHPLADAKFAYFIFILIPVQTLFAHNWLTLPQYVSRAYTGTVQEYFEFFVNLNPILIFILAPLAAAITRKANVFKMMVVGTFIMALAPSFIAFERNIFTLLAFILVMSIGEAIWQPRFLQYAAEIAPEGRTGAYMGVAQFPWFLTKILTGLYAGWFLMKYCPEHMVENPNIGNPELMWTIYTAIALISPLGLFLAKKWIGASIHKANESK